MMRKKNNIKTISVMIQTIPLKNMIQINDLAEGFLKIETFYWDMVLFT